MWSFFQELFCNVSLNNGFLLRFKPQDGRTTALLLRLRISSAFLQLSDLVWTCWITEHELYTSLPEYFHKFCKSKEMFKKFDEKENISGFQQLKTSVQKGIRSKIIEQYPYIDTCINDVLPKKEPFRLMKCHEHIEVLVGANGDYLFFRHREGFWVPTLRLLHKYPYILPWQQVDKGAIRFVLSGANIMCPGLTSPGARMTPCPKGAIVAIMAEGKQHALAVGITSMSTQDIQSVNKGIGVENYHYLNDGLWILKPMK